MTSLPVGPFLVPLIPSFSSSGAAPSRSASPLGDLPDVSAATLASRNASATNLSKLVAGAPDAGMLGGGGADAMRIEEAGSKRVRAPNGGGGLAEVAEGGCEDGDARTANAGSPISKSPRIARRQQTQQQQR